MFLSGKENFIRENDYSFSNLNEIGINHSTKLNVVTALLLKKEDGYVILKSRYYLRREEYEWDRTCFEEDVVKSYEEYLEKIIGEFEVKTLEEVKKMSVEDFIGKNIIIEEC